jgi:hypothetical protein
VDANGNWPDSLADEFQRDVDGNSAVANRLPEEENETAGDETEKNETETEILREAPCLRQL